MRKPTICMGKNKDADQLRGNREADQRLCFRYTDSTFPPLLIPKFSRFWVSSVTVQAGLCWTWSETQIVGFVMHRLMRCIIRAQTRQEIQGEVLSLSQKIWEKLGFEFQVCLFILYIFTSPSAQNKEKFVHLGRLFLPSRPVGYSLMMRNQQFGFRPGPTQTDLYSHRNRLEA